MADTFESPQRSPVRILYIVGAKRSGSTIFSQVLGEADGVFAVGELAAIWGYK